MFSVLKKCKANQRKSPVTVKSVQERRELGDLGTWRALNQPGVLRDGFLEEVLPDMSLQDIWTGQSIKYCRKKKIHCAYIRGHNGREARVSGAVGRNSQRSCSFSPVSLSSRFL